MQKVLGMITLVVSAAQFAMATPAAPEIGVGSAGSAIALISGAMLIFHGRRKK
jgi:hypothetical protein